MTELEQVAAAFDSKDYRTAAQLLKTLRQRMPENPWVQLYVGRLHEVSGKLAAAESAYRQLLRNSLHPKVATQARQGMQRVEAIVKAQRQQAIAEATADPANTELGFLMLAPVAGEARSIAAQNFARIMKLDAYTARMQLPSRSWQLYRTGPIGELQVYGQELQSAQIPAFWVSLADIEKLRVFRVLHFQSVAPQITVVCQNEFDQVGSLTFEWSEVTRRVEGLLPIFGDVIDQGAWGKLQWKEQTQDYAHIWDLHIPGRQSILRFCDSNYLFQEDAAIADQVTPQTTTRINWNHLIDFLNQKLPNLETWSDFTGFAETTADHIPPLSRIKPQIDIERKAETHWDPAFQLYSALVFLQST